MEDLGIDLKLFLGQVVNFLILLFILWRFAYKPLVKMLEERRLKVSKSLDDAEKIEKKLSLTESESRRIISQSQKEAAKIIEEATEIASKQKGEIVLQAQTQADRIIQSAKDESLKIRSQISTEAKHELSDIVVLALNKIVGENLNETEKTKLTKDALAKI